MKVVFALLLAALLSLSSNAPLVLAATETQLPPFSYDQLGADLPSSNAYHPFGFQPDGSDSVVAPPGSPEVAFPFQAPSLPPDMSPQQRAEAAGLHNYDQQLGPSPYNLNLAELASRSAPYVATTQVQAQAPAMQAYFNNPAAGYSAQPQYPRFQQQQGYYSNGAYTVAPGQGAMYHPSPQPAYTVGPAGAQLTESVDALNVSPRFIEQMAKSLPDPRSVLPRASRSKYAAGASGPYPVPVSSPPGASGPQRRPPPPPSAADASRFKETEADSSDAAVPPPIDEVNKQLPRFVQRHASAAQATSKQHKSKRAHRVSSLASKPPPTVADDQDEMPASSEAGIDDAAIDPSAAAVAAQSIDDKFPPPPPQDAAVPPPPQAADPDALGDGTDADHDTVPDPTMPADHSLPGGFDAFDHSGDGAGAADPLSPMPLNDGDAAPATPGVLNREEPQPEEATPLQPLVDADSHKFMQKGLSTADMAAAAAAADAASAAKVGASASARTAAQAKARAAAAAAAAAALDQPAPAPAPAAPTPITPSLSTDLSGAATVSVAPPPGAPGAPGAGDPLAAPAPRNDGQLYKCVGNGESCKLSFNPNDIDWKVVTVPEGTFGKTQAGAAGSNPQLDQQVAQQGAVAAGAIKSGPLSQNPAIAALQTKYYQKRAEVERDKLWLLKVKQIISNYQVKMRTVQSSISERTRELAGDRQQIMNLIKQEKAQYLAKELQIALQSLQKLEGASRSLNMKISQLGKTKSGLAGTIARLRNALGGAASGGMGDISVPSSTGSSNNNFLTVGADSAYTPSSTSTSPAAAVTDALSSNFALLEEQSPKSHIDLRRLMEMQEANKEGHNAIRDVISLLEEKAKRVAAAEESLVPPPVYDLPQVGSDPVTHVLSDRAPSPSHGRHHSMMADFEPASEELAFQRKLQRIIAAEQNM